MKNFNSVTELTNLINVLLPGADVVVDLEDSQVVILTNRYVNLDQNPDAMTTL
jgi:hypothetical protein